IPGQGGGQPITGPTIFIAANCPGGPSLITKALTDLDPTKGKGWFAFGNGDAGTGTLGTPTLTTGNTMSVEIVSAPPSTVRTALVPYFSDLLGNNFAISTITITSFPEEAG